MENKYNPGGRCFFFGKHGLGYYGKVLTAEGDKVFVQDDDGNRWWINNKSVVMLDKKGKK